MNQGIIKRYRRYLPVKERFIVSLNEGSTPLIPSCHVQGLLKGCELYFKYEGLNPTGSFKDRGMTYALSRAYEKGFRVVICASTGNTSASAAAYAARAQLRCIVLIPKGKVAFGKLSQAVRYGAQIIQINGNFDEALKAVMEISQRFPVALVNSVNPDRLQGQITAAFEVIEDLGDAPDYHFLPVGNAGNITAYWRGYQIYYQEKKSTKQPRMMGFQAAGAAPLVLGRVVDHPETIASAIRIGNPASAAGALKARDESQGLIGKITDAQILAAYDLLARREGIFCEPASAASVAGVMQLAKKGWFKKGQKIVCTLTGHGLKDPEIAMRNAEKPASCSSNIKEIIKKIKL